MDTTSIERIRVTKQKTVIPPTVSPIRPASLKLARAQPPIAIRPEDRHYLAGDISSGAA
jgi:hypothetical protein